MAEGRADMDDDIGDLPNGEDDNDSDREDDRLFAWMVNDDMDEDEEDEEVEDEQSFDTEAVEQDTPAERSGHVAVVDRNIMYVWGGYKVCTTSAPSLWFCVFVSPS